MHSSFRYQIDCVAVPSRIEAGAPQCLWDKEDLSCSLAPPPSDMVFTVVVSLLTTIVMIPLVVILSIVLEIYASKWPGKTGDGNVITEDLITDAADEDNLEKNNSKTFQSDTVEKQCFGEVIKNGIAKDKRTQSDLARKIAQFVYNGEFTCTGEMTAKPDGNSFVANHRHLLSDFSTTDEEVSMILNRVHAFLFVGDVENCWLPWEALKETDHRSAERGAKIKAIEERLGVFPDGNFLPLTLRQRLFFGTPIKRLQYKIAKVRRGCKEIVEAIETFKPWEEDAKDTRLIKYFILECLSPFKRHTLQMNSAGFEEVSAWKPSWFMYIASWVFMTACLCFFLYWILAWGVYEGNEVLRVWGAVIGTSIAKDIFLVQLTKTFVLYYLPAQAMQPQLMRIRRVLADISMAFINHDDLGSERNKVRDVDDISVVQHMSAACRASRSSALENLSSAWLLQQVRKCIIRNRLDLYD